MIARAVNVVADAARASASVVLINPPLLAHRRDPFTTGIVYMPLSLAYAAAATRAAGFPTTVIDAFGEAPMRARRSGRFLVLGLPPVDVVARIPAATAALVVYANAVVDHETVLALIRAVRAARPRSPIVVLENTQAVTAYALTPVAHEFRAAGASHVLTGGREGDLIALLDRIAMGGHEVDAAEPSPAGGAARAPYVAADLDGLPFPAWDLFPLERYWDLRHAHGPQSARRYLPLQTSRGCPYPCAFCVVPATNGQRWVGKTPSRVVDEIEHLRLRYGVTEFHIEDLNPTVSEERIRGICEEIGRRGVRVRWKIVAGTKVETIKDEATIDLMARAGCTYISISPETGSPRLLKLMRKPFDLEHAVRLIRRMQLNGIRSQACFVLGFPGETAEDRSLTRALVRRLTREGVDEIALFVITPVPGSAIFDQLTGYASLSELSFSPSWRADYAQLSRFRLRLYAQFLLWKVLYHPEKILAQPLNLLRRRFHTKMEMAPYRAAMLRLLELRAGRSS